MVLNTGADRTIRQETDVQLYLPQLPDLQQRIVIRRLLHRRFGLARRAPPHHRCDAEQEHDDADAGPHHRIAGQVVLHQRLVRPVAGVGEIGLARAVGRGGPRRPEVEARQQVQLLRIGLRAGRYGELASPLPEQLRVIGFKLAEGLRALRLRSPNRP